MLQRSSKYLAPHFNANSFGDNMMTLFKSLTFLILATFALAGHAQIYPSRPIKLIVPYAVGQGTDIAARFLGDELAKSLKQAIVVDNRPGAGGTLGGGQAARAAACSRTRRSPRRCARSRRRSLRRWAPCGRMCTRS
jgi:hypothetical protein